MPQVQYQDLGLTLKVTPNVMRNSDVALNIDLKIDALAGSSINNVPVLNNRAYQGVVTLRQGETVVVAGELDKSEMRNISGMPGLSEIPGLNDVTDKDVTTEQRHSADRDDAARGARHPGWRPYADDARGEGDNDAVSVSSTYCVIRPVSPGIERSA